MEEINVSFEQFAKERFFSTENRKVASNLSSIGDPEKHQALVNLGKSIQHIEAKFLKSRA